MRLIFSGNDYKYEIEAVMKLFLPAQRFEFSFNEDKPLFAGDFALVRKARLEKYTLLCVWVSYGEKHARKSERISPDALDKECIVKLSQLLYLAMSEITGITSQWGTLTGVRPVKQVHRFIDEGFSCEEIYDELEKKYLVSRKKCEKAYQTAQVQRSLLGEVSLNNKFGLYISIPFCPTRCSYCSFISQSASGAAVKKLIPEYVENLCAEIRYTGKIAERLSLKPNCVYFGGGTPTTLEAPFLERIMKAIAEAFDLSYVCEYTVEAGRPDTITKEKLETLIKNGCTRISINPQTLNDSVLEQIGRKHTAAQFFAAFELAKGMGFRVINTDLIASLPTDSLESFTKTIEKILELAPENITLHTLSIKRSSRINEQSKSDAIVRSNASEMVDYASKRLSESGYRPYYLYKQKNMAENLENTGWAKPGFDSIYNILIMEELETIIALGAAGSTKLVGDGRIERIFNYKYPMDYNNNFGAMLKKKDKIEEFYAKEK